nr:MAG TPA_asm: hypothetical protein [Caudoviricetes sp.]
MSDKDKLIWFTEFYTESQFSKDLKDDKGSLSEDNFKLSIKDDKYTNDKEIIKETDGTPLEKFLYNKSRAIKNFGVMNKKKKYYFDTKSGMFKIGEKEYRLHFIYQSKDINITNYEFTDYAKDIIFNRFFQIVGTESKEKGCIFGYKANLKYKEFDYNSIKMNVLYLVDDTEYFQINITSSFDIRYIKLVLEDNQDNTYSKIITLEKDNPNQFIFELK